MKGSREISFLLQIFIFSCVESEEFIIPNIKDDIETRRTVCSLHFDRGVACGPSVIRWYFDKNKQICRSFQYNGCEGNSNNFPTLDFCNSYCNRACPYDAKPLRKEDGGIKICTSQESCPSDYNCTAVIVENAELHYCCPTKYAICNQVPVVGEKCAEDSARFHFNPSQKTCSRFTFKGCNGNGNNFNTSGDCMEFCQSTACLPGEHALRDKNGIKTCDPANGNISCSTGFTCRRDNLYDRNICCGSKPRVCPEDSKPYVESGVAKEVRFCELGASDSCPSPYICAPNFDENSNYCCAPVSDDGYCLEGQKIYRDEITSLPKVCHLHVTSDCPKDFTCTGAYDFAIEGYCCSGMPNNGTEEFDFSAVLMDDPIFDNNTLGFRNVSRETNDLLMNVSRLAAPVLSNASQTIMISTENVSQTMMNAAPARIVTETITLTNSSSQLANSGKEAFVNLITECQGDSVCPIGFVCRRNNTTKRSTCLLVSLAANDFIPSDKFENEKSSLFTSAKNLTELSSGQPKATTGCSNNESCPFDQFCCESEKICYPLNSNCSVVSNSMTNVISLNETCVADSDCSMNSTCAKTAKSGICVQQQLLINVTKCSDVKATNATNNLLFCSVDKPCPLPYQCSTIDKLSVCCGPF